MILYWIYARFGPYQGQLRALVHFQVWYDLGNVYVPWPEESGEMLEMLA